MRNNRNEELAMPVTVEEMYERLEDREANRLRLKLRGLLTNWKWRGKALCALIAMKFWRLKRFWRGLRH